MEVITEQLNLLENIYNALNTIEIKGYPNCGTLFNCMNGLKQVFNNLQSYNESLEDNDKKESQKVFIDNVKIVDVQPDKKEQMEKQKKKRAFVKEEVESEE